MTGSPRRLPLVVRIATKTRCRLMPIEDRLQIGNAELLRCLPRFDSDRGRHSTFVTWKVTGAIRSAGRRVDPLDVAGSRSRPRADGRTAPVVCRGDDHGECVQRLDDNARRQAIAGALRALPPRQADIIAGRLAGRSADDMAAAAGVSVKAVRMAEPTACRRLRRLLAGFDG